VLDRVAGMKKADISIQKSYEKAGKQISYHISFSDNTKMASLNGEDAQYKVSCEVSSLGSSVVS